MLLFQGHRGMMLEKVMRQNKIVRDQVREELGLESSPEGEDDMSVSVGNEIHNHYQFMPDSSPTPSPPTPTPTPTPTTPSGFSIKPWALAALIGLSGLGGIAATYFLTRPSIDTDTDTATDITPSFGTPQYPGQ